MNHTLVIAEAGVNHNGDLKLACRLVEAAAEVGADVVKFQAFQAQEIATSQAAKAAYQTEATSEAESQLSMLKKLELTADQHMQLFEHSQACGIEFLSTAFDSASIDMLTTFNLRRWKIPSGEITNLPYLRRVGAQMKPVILSTGMANLGEVEAAINVLEHAGTSREQITVLHCTTEYPAPLNEVNLRAMQTIAQAFGVAVGYSDHTQGIAVPIAAVAMGATVIEKHLTLDRSLEGPDHRASSEPDQFAAMVQGIRAIEQAMGDGIKQPTASESANLLVVRKSIVAVRAIQAGEIFTADNITSKRPGTGISPMHWDAFMGRQASHAYAPDELIEW
jgi:N,N'-diacetyllegionaminate synthase